MVTSSSEPLSFARSTFPLLPPTPIRRWNGPSSMAKSHASGLPLRPSVFNSPCVSRLYYPSSCDRPPDQLGSSVPCRTLNSMPEAERPGPKECYFIATHEPCSLCLSAITWSGFDNFYYLFSYEDTKDAFKIPHDLKILKEVFNCDNGEYNRSNDFWTAHSISDLIGQLSPEEKEKAKLRMEVLRKKYDGMSSVYQEHKACNHIPLS
mmetsp:Transcript_33949/g.96194  ORF Transcript_33949/g.96194 Transcript_33949/m.96194 type:complete len:207 (+) Transcript_33949:280-900(+)